MNELNKIRRLVFHFYVPDYWKTSGVVKMHLACLEHYSDVFDEAVIIVSVNDVNNVELIKEFETEFVKRFKCKNITFKVTQNNDLRETQTLYNEVMSKLNELDGLTMFGHSKGIGNESYADVNMYQISRWIIGMYYFCLSRISEVELKLYDIRGITYGAFKTYSNSICFNANKWIYSGTFYWINTKKLQHKIDTDGKKPRECYDRFYSENVLGDILPFNNPEFIYQTEATSFNGSYLTGENLDFYNNVDDYISLCTIDYELEKFNNFYNEIIEQCGLKYQQ